MCAFLYYELSASHCILDILLIYSQKPYVTLLTLSINFILSVLVIVRKWRKEVFIKDLPGGGGGGGGDIQQDSDAKWVSIDPVKIGVKS
jgi:hypothetical protein